MVQQADPLVVSDDPVVVATIAAATSALGRRSRSTVSATEAEAMLRMRSPTLAVIHSGCAGESASVKRRGHATAMVIASGLQFRVGISP